MGIRIIVAGIFALAWIFLSPPVAAQAVVAAEAPVTSLMQLRESVAVRGRVIVSLKIQGTICSLNHEGCLIALQDGNTTDILELADIPENLTAGDRVELTGENCTVTRGAHSIQIGTAPVVEIDGYHSNIVRSGNVYLEKGMQPLRVDWYNGAGNGSLNVEYEGDGIPRGQIPESSLWHEGEKAGEFLPGLQFSYYERSNWYTLAEFACLESLKEGVAAGLDLGVRTRQDHSGIRFRGYLEVPTAGIYQFHLSSDDGSRLFVGSGHVHNRIVAKGLSDAIRTESNLSNMSNQWTVAEGVVTFVSKAGGRLKLELSTAASSFPVTVLNPAGADARQFLHRRLKVSGVGSAGGMVALSSADLGVIGDEPRTEEILTNASEIRQLKKDEAMKTFQVRIEGTVTMVNVGSLVIQDMSGGVFVHHVSLDSADAPKAGERWRIEGRTAPGDFSPVVYTEIATFLGDGIPPVPTRPVWDQYVSGSLDAEVVEVQGVVVGESQSALKLLTQNGVVTISDDPLYPLPTNSYSPEEKLALIGSLVRIRGVYASSWDKSIRRVHPAEFKLGNSVIAVDEPAPINAFEIPASKASELLLFSSQSNALKRVKLKGTVLYSRGGEHFLFDGEQGFRAMGRDTGSLSSGAEVEAVGFPRLGGPSPVLLEAEIRETGSLSFPSVTQVTAEGLPDASLDSTLVFLDAEVLGESRRQDERVLEMRIGQHHLKALVPVAGESVKPLARGSLVKLTGVYVSASTELPLSGPEPFEIRLRESGDLVVTKHGPWWTGGHTIMLVAVLSGGLILVSIWGAVLRRTVATRSKQLSLEIEGREMVERQRLMEMERSRVAQDLHDELGAGLTEAGILSALLKNPDIGGEAKNGYLSQLGAVCSTLVTGLDEIVWAVNPRYDSVADLAEYFTMFAPRFLGLADIRCRLKVDGSIPAIPLDPKRRHGIFLAVKEALNNVVRHAEASEVHLATEVVEGDLVISISDDGQGFDVAAIPHGSEGLRGMRERVEQLGGKFFIDSAPGKGTSVRFVISLEGEPS